MADASQARDGKGATRVAVAPRVVKVITGAGITASPTGNAQGIPLQGHRRLPLPDHRGKPGR